MGALPAAKPEQRSEQEAVFGGRAHARGHASARCLRKRTTASPRSSELVDLMWADGLIKLNQKATTVAVSV